MTPSKTMTPLERTLAALSFQEPDRVPLYILPTMHGARELGLTIPDYFAKASHVVEGQIRLQKRYGHDCYNTFHYAAIETEAWGMETIFYPDGPPNAGAPIFTSNKDILKAKAPRIECSEGLQRVLDVIRGLSSASQGQIPVLGIAIAPFSLPILQLGFDHYLDLLVEGDPEVFNHLMRINLDFCAAWTNAQSAAGANLICFFDPMSSPNMVTHEIFREKGLPIAREMMARTKGPKAVHQASGLVGEILPELLELPLSLLSVGSKEDLRGIKRQTKGKAGIIGNLDSISMCSWSPQECERQVRRAISAAAQGGGFLLGDQHGEIPWQVPDAVLSAIAEATRTWGTYPLRPDLDEVT